MKFAGGLLTMAPRAYLRPYEADVMIDDGGYSYPTYEPSPPPPPPSPPPPTVDPWEQWQTPPYIPAPLPPVYTPPPPPPLIEEIYYSLPYIDPETGGSVITPHYNATTGEWIPIVNLDVDAPGDDSDAPPPLMGLDDPFAVVADAARQLFAGLGGGSAPPTTTYVPVMSGSGSSAGGSSMLIVLLVIGALGAGAWWYFKGRKGSNATAG